MKPKINKGDTKQKVLIIGDDIKYNDRLSNILSSEGYIISKAFDVDSSLAMLKEQHFDVILLDRITRESGMPDYAQFITDKYPHIYLIILSSHPDIPSCVESIKSGADDYIIKNNDFTSLVSLLKKLVTKEKPVVNVKPEIQIKRTDSTFGFHNIIGNSDALKDAISLAKRVSATDATVLLQGETGTGKELFANAIHNSGLRNGKRFMALNCSSFSSNLLESELFGYVAGAFTGASKDKKGLLEEVSGGTLFLDEIGEMNLEIQAKLLRVLEDGELIKIADTKVTKIDIRLISATHKDLSIEVSEKRFREDLFYRLNIFSMTLPPLRERKQDIHLLADYFIKLFSQKLNKHIVGMTEEYAKLLTNYHWKGNIRELKNTIERSVILADNAILSEDKLPYEILSYLPAGYATDSPFSLSVFERVHIHKVLTATKWNKTEAARMLNISVSTLYRKIENYLLSS
jgi:two-component system NtrC family response regulator